MPVGAKLKVYRTAIGFHDAYVAAASQKAALAAWGSDKDLFARGAAELVKDTAATAEPLASPGKVIKRLRGTEAEQVAALPPDKPKASNAVKQASTPLPSKALPKPKPRPSRSALDAAESRVSDVEREHAEQIKVLVTREAALAKERRELEKVQAAELERLQHRRDQKAADYDQALRRWKA